MLVRINTIADPGNLDKERLILEAAADLDIGDYVVFKTGYSEGIPTNQLHAAYWFPDREVKEGDVIVLSTKAGQEFSRPHKDHNVHFFFMNLEDAIWNQPRYLPSIARYR